MLDWFYRAFPLALATVPNPAVMSSCHRDNWASTVAGASPNSSETGPEGTTSRFKVDYKMLSISLTVKGKLYTSPETGKFKPCRLLVTHILHLRATLGIRTAWAIFRTCGFNRIQFLLKCLDFRPGIIC